MSHYKGNETTCGTKVGKQVTLRRGGFPADVSVLSISPTLSGQPLSDPLDMVMTGENVKSWHTDWMYQDVEAPGGGVGDERRLLFMDRNKLGESCIRQTKKEEKQVQTPCYNRKDRSRGRDRGTQRWR